MKTLQNHLIGVDQGDVPLFSDFEDGGEMWTGQGPREKRRTIPFSSPFRQPPAVHLSISMLDADTAAAVRLELKPEAVTREGFDIVCRTWLDTRIARMRVTWLAIGSLPHEDDWDLI
ncbi:H-type lectin domain-containing protein [Pseudodonghicola flavimaris]|uniref:H-type lectin domain-containing protein n=1 Tax=Pseudodonghicola flavimaris TaxID=3050036 RepID=A0ABT7EYL7_9RHOB|nr:H-type lectin domain-containing protein [Pseudodonghicola flavimaris]MDK3017433.1 H-type lectin domain-containing protein [Pseudodonghicola flavimaris]